MMFRLVAYRSPKHVGPMTEAAIDEIFRRIEIQETTVATAEDLMNDGHCVSRFVFSTADGYGIPKGDIITMMFVGPYYLGFPQATPSLKSFLESGRLEWAGKVLPPILNPATAKLLPR